MRRITQDRDLFQVTAGELITITVQASRVPFQATFSDLGSGNQWAKIQEPTPGVPIEKRQFTVPAKDREFFDVVYAFPPSDQADPAAKYSVSISSDITDGPRDVLPPFIGDINDLFYEFRLSGAAPGTAAAVIARTSLGLRSEKKSGSKRGLGRGKGR